jgi:hypothetical protein
VQATLIQFKAVDLAERSQNNEFFQGEGKASHIGAGWVAAAVLDPYSSPPVAVASGASTSVVDVTSVNSRGLAGPTLASALSVPSVARQRPSSLASMVALAELRELGAKRSIVHAAARLGRHVVEIDNRQHALARATRRYQCSQQASRGFRRERCSQRPSSQERWLFGFEERRSADGHSSSWHIPCSRERC